MQRQRPILKQPDDPSIRLIPLTKGQVAIIDTDRFEWAMQWLWHAHYGPNTGDHYAARGYQSGGRQKTLLLHRQLLGEPDSQVDHANGDTLDCRIQNLRLCTPSQNKANHRLARNNKSGYSGVYQYMNKWRAEINHHGKHIHLGTFVTKEEAIAARKAAEPKYHGQFAYSMRQNLSPKKPPIRDITPALLDGNRVGNK